MVKRVLRHWAGTGVILAFAVKSVQSRSSLASSSFVKTEHWSAYHAKHDGFERMFGNKKGNKGII